MGRITMNSASLAGGDIAMFTLNNSFIGSNDALIVNVSGAGTAGAYVAFVASMTNGSVSLALQNLTAGALAEAVVLNFAVIHGQA